MEFLLIPLIAALFAFFLVGPAWAVREWVRDLLDDRARHRVRRRNLY